MTDIQIRKSGRAGRITLNRPKALNALSYEMCTEIERALDAWRDDTSVEVVLIDAQGPKAFCAGGDIAEMYQTGMAGNYAYGRRFWQDEYRMNAKIAGYPKPVVSFMQGFTMGGGVGVGCHGSHRIVGGSSRVAMPECGIGLIPDVGGTYLLARAPGRLGTYYGLTAARMTGHEAIRCGFADHFIDEAAWEDLKDTLCAKADLSAIAALDTGLATPVADEDQINALFAGDTVDQILDALKADGGDFAASALKTLARNSPLSMDLTVRMIARIRAEGLSLPEALQMEYRVSHRVMEHGDFLEGIRAAIIDKDRSPKWRHALGAVPQTDIQTMLAPLGADALTFEEETA